MSAHPSTGEEFRDGDGVSNLDRLLDANFNRAAEGLRVVEDVLRLGQNNSVLSFQAKRLRHALADILAELDGQALILSRNVEADVGRTARTIQEYSRENTADMLTANVKRAQQSVRTIEECLKPLSLALAVRAEALRYDLYQLELAIAAGAWAREQLATRALYVLIDGRDSQQDFEALAGVLIDAEVDLIQLRDKNLEDRELIARGEILSRLTKNRETRWIMNDRPDLAIVAGADGVHLGQTDMTVAQARRLAGKPMWIGVSAHSLEQAERAVIDGANYIGVGPIFESRTKAFERICTVDLVAQVAARVSLPFFAIGGLTPENVDQVLDAGAQRIAVGGAIVDALDCRAAIEQFRSRLRATTTDRRPRMDAAPT